MAVRIRDKIADLSSLQSTLVTAVASVFSQLNADKNDSASPNGASSGTGRNN